MVIAFHATFYLSASSPVAPWSWASAVCDRMWAGVAFFFVISGYCISATADAERKKKRGTIEYFKRRFRRIFPPYWIAVAIFVVLVAETEAFAPRLFYDALHPIEHPANIGFHWLTNLSLTESWAGNLTSGVTYFLGPAWSLCYEEQFYAVTGALLLLCPSRFFTGAAVITVLTLGARQSGLYLRGAFWDGHWLVFAAGIGVYWSINYASRRGGLAIVGTLLVGIAFFSRNPTDLLAREAQDCQFMVAAFTFAILLLVLHFHDRAITESKLTRPLFFCGTMCYSLYLIHWPMVKAISHGAVLLGVTSPAATICAIVPACFAVSILAAFPFHVFVERRFMHR